MFILSALCVLALGDLAAIYLHFPAPPPAAPPPAASPVPGPAGPSFDVVRADPEGNTVIAGRASPGVRVTIMDNGAILGSVIADDQGAFVFLPATPLSPGAHEITLSETMPNGAIIAGAQTASINLPGNGSQALTVLSGPDGSRILSGQGQVPGQLGMGAVDYDTQGHAIFSGTAPAGAKITLHLGNVLIGTTMADSKGFWHIIAATPANGGMLTLNATTREGANLAAINAPFALETLKSALAEGRVMIAPGDNLWVIARHIYGHGVLYTLIYTANAGQIHDPNLIFPGQDFVLPKPKAQ